MCNKCVNSYIKFFYYISQSLYVYFFLYIHYMDKLKMLKVRLPYLANKTPHFNSTYEPPTQKGPLA